MIELQQIASEAEASIAAATELGALDDLRVEFLGKKGRLTGLLKGLGALSNEERPAAGAKINEVKQALQAARAAQPAARGHAAERELARLRCALPGKQARRAAA